MNIEKESEIEINQEFVQSGGKILEKYSDGRPKRWLCGQGKNSEIVDPPNKENEAIHYLNEEGEWEAGNPDQELLEEIKRWRSDWHNVSK